MAGMDLAMPLATKIKPSNSEEDVGEEESTGQSI
jgi:hypothetical protein